MRQRLIENHGYSRGIPGCRQQHLCLQEKEKTFAFEMCYKFYGHSPWSIMVVFWEI